MNFKPKRWQIITAIIALILMFLNPSLDQFGDFIGHSKLKMAQRNLVRNTNLLVFSIYGDQSLDDNGNVDSVTRYVGVLNNFISLN